MMRMKTSAPAAPSAFGPMASETKTDEWEVRPCGMLVQKRSSDSGSASPPAPTIRVRVKHGSNTHELYISSQSTFGELKKMLSGPTGLHHEDQKIVFKGKERQSSAFLDISGVKNRSKLVVVEDPIARARRCLQMRRAAHLENAASSISKITLIVDNLASKVSALESMVSKGKKVSEKDILTLIELLMNELIKLDGVAAADGHVKMNRQLQVRRVQKYVETLDLIKRNNEKIEKHQQEQQAQPAAKVVLNMKKWETFDSLFSSPSPSAALTTTNASSRLDWEIF